MTSEFEFEQTSLQIKLPKVEETEFTLKYPTQITLGADLLIELKNQVGAPNDMPKWLIPLHKDFISEKIPYFAAMFKEGSNWRENKKANDDSTSEYRFGIQDLIFDRPQTVKNETVLQYFTRIYLPYITDQHSDNWRPDLFFTTDNVLEFLELSNFLNDEDTEGHCQDYIGGNMCNELMLKMFDFPNVRDLTGIHAKTYLIKLKSEIQGLKEKVKELNSSPKLAPCTREHVAPASTGFNFGSRNIN